MAKIHKGIATGSGFAYKGKDLNFSRDVYDNFTDLLEDEKKYGFPDGFKTVVKDAVTGSDDYYSNNSYNNATFIYKFVSDTDHMLNWHCVAYDNIDEYLWPSQEDDFKLGKISGITHKTESLKNVKYVWNTNGGYADLNDYALKSSIPSLNGYVTDDSLADTLKVYAKLANADFKVLTLNGTAVATTKSVSDALSAYAKLNDSVNFSALTVGNEAVATQTWTDTKINTALTQALTYKGGIAAQTDITKAEAEGTIKVGNVYVCTTESNYTLNGGTVHLEAGDTLICKSITGTEKWNIVQANINGAVTKSSDLASGQLVVGTGLSSVKALDAGENGKFLKVEKNSLTWGDVPVYGLNNGSPTTNGLVPYDGSAKSGTFLRIDGTWEKPHDTTYDDATTTTPGLMAAADKVKLNGIEAGANKYVLHVATDSSLGGIKIGYTENAGEKKYKVQVSSDGKAFVYVPWTDTNTTYTDMNGATESSAGTHGLVPAPTAGQQGLFLCGNGKWEAPADTVYAAGTGISIDNKVIKNTGVISIAIDPESADTLLVNNDDRITIDDVTNASNAGHADTADTASKLSTSTAGNANTPVYFDGGVPKPLEFTIEKSVPSNAVFTDTTYTLSRNADDHAKISLTSVNGSDTITIDNVAHATSADSATNAVHATSADSATTATTATKVSNVLEIENYNPTGELLIAETYNGSSKTTINCITVEDINGLFPS